MSECLSSPLTSTNRIAVKADKAPNTRNSQYVENLGTIEVIVLRCHADDVEVPRLIPDRARETKAAPTAPLQEIDRSGRERKAEPKASSVREPCDEIEGLFGLFDGAKDFKIDGRIISFDDNPCVFPTVIHEGNDPVWDPHAGEYIENIGYRRRPPADDIARIQRDHGLHQEESSRREFAHQNEYAQPKDLSDVAGMIECDPQSLDARPQRNKDWHSLLARFRAIFVRRNPYALHYGGLRALYEDIVEYEKITENIKKDAPEAYAVESYDLPMVHELEQELVYMGEDVDEKWFAKVHTRLHNGRPTDRPPKYLSSIMPDDPDPDIRPPETPFDSTPNEAASVSTGETSPEYGPELDFNMLFLDGAGDNWNDPRDNWKDPIDNWKDPNDNWKDPNDNWKDPRGRSRHRSGVPNAGGWQEVGGGTAPNARSSAHRAYGQTPAQHGHYQAQGFHHTNSPQQVRFADAPGVYLNPQFKSMPFRQPRMKDYLHEVSPTRSERDKSPGLMWGCRNGPIATKEEYQRFLKWQEKYYGYAEDEHGRRYKIDKGDEDAEKPRERTLEEDYANGVRNKNFDLELTEEEMKEVKQRQEKSKPKSKSKSKSKSESSYSHGFGKGDGDANQWNDPKSQWNNSPKQQGWGNDPAAEAQIDDTCWGRPLPAPTSPPQQPGYGTAALAGGGQFDTNQNGGNTHKVWTIPTNQGSPYNNGWNGIHDHLIPKWKTEILDIDGAFRKRDARERAEKEAKKPANTQSVRSSNNGGNRWSNKGENGTGNWQTQGNDGGWDNQGNEQTWGDQGSNRGTSNANGWDNNSQNKPASKGWGTASQSKSKTGSQGWDNGNRSRTNSKPASSANSTSEEPKQARTRRVDDDVKSKDHIKSYWKAWNQPPADDDSAATKKHEIQRDAYKYPAMPRPAIPSSEAKDKSYGVQAGKGADYSHKCRRPIYLDSMEEPYAVFTFKYRSKRAVEKILNVKVDEVDYKKIEEEIVFQKMMSMSKAELAKENAKLKMKKDRHDRHSTAGSTTKTARAANEGWVNGGGADAGNASWGDGGSKKSSHGGGNRNDAKGDAGGWTADQGTPAGNFNGW